MGQEDGPWSFSGLNGASVYTWMCSAENDTSPFWILETEPVLDFLLEKLCFEERPRVARGDVCS